MGDLLKKRFFTMEDLFSFLSAGKITVFIYIKMVDLRRADIVSEKLGIAKEQLLEKDYEFCQVDFDDLSQAKQCFESFLPVEEWENDFYVTLFNNGKLLRKTP